MFAGQQAEEFLENGQPADSRIEHSDGTFRHDFSLFRLMATGETFNGKPAEKSREMPVFALCLWGKTCYV
jgi:hypothetical protein